jgi:hypothetical protein
MVKVGVGRSRQPVSLCEVSKPQRSRVCCITGRDSSAHGFVEEVDRLEVDLRGPLIAGT